MVRNGNAKVIAYLEGLIADWEQQDLERRKQSDANKARVQEEIKKKLDAQEKAAKEASEKETDPDGGTE